MEVGSTVVYGSTSGGCQSMTEGVVEKITPYDFTYNNWGKQGSKPEKVTIKRYKVGIQAKHTSRYGDYEIEHPLEGGGRLSYPMFQNITVVPPREE